MPEFTSTGISYLVRRVDSGIYYWQVKIGGSCKRGSLRTKSQSVAKTKLPIALDQARADHEVTNHQNAKDTLGDWLQIWLERTCRRPELKDRTRRDYAQRVRLLGDGLPVDTELVLVTADELRAWWEVAGGKGSPERANKALHIVRGVFKIARAEGLRSDDPTIDLKRVPLGKTVLELPTGADLAAVVESIRSQGKPFSEESADMVEWLAYSGMRIGEMPGLMWEDVRCSEEGWHVIVRGGDQGTKNRDQRIVPAVPPLVEVIMRRRTEESAGPVFHQISPVRALTNACVRLELNHIKVHDLRHLFATTCLESGVDPVTVALWMGHKDKGELLMRRYAHIRERHLFAQAGKVTFT